MLLTVMSPRMLRRRILAGLSLHSWTKIICTLCGRPGLTSQAIRRTGDVYLGCRNDARSSCTCQRRKVISRPGLHWFVDNQDAVNALSRGDSSAPDISRLTAVTHLLYSHLQMRVGLNGCSPLRTSLMTFLDFDAKRFVGFVTMWICDGR